MAEKPAPRFQKQLLLLVLALGLSLTYQNCTEFGAIGEEFAGWLGSQGTNFGPGRHPLYGGHGGSNLVPSGDGVDTNCLNSPKAHHACLIMKNPVAQRGASLGALTSTSDLTPYQTYGVKLTGLLDTGRLENGTISVDSARGQGLSTRGSIPYVRAQPSNHTQFMLIQNYYWLNRATEYIEGRTGVLPAKNKAIKVFVDDSISGWVPKKNSIHLKTDDRGSLLGWSAEVAIHAFGVANLYHATNGASSQYDMGKHRLCQGQTAGCCTSKLGCAKAIENGVGEYFSAMMFPNNTAFGDTLADSTAGLSRCSQNRALNRPTRLTSDAAYSACVSSAGDAVMLGIMYGSLWWAIRNANGGRSQEVDTLFMKHLALLNGSDDFSSALNKAKSLDSSLFAGRNTAAINAEMAASGL